MHATRLTGLLTAPSVCPKANGAFRCCKAAPASRGAEVEEEAERQASKLHRLEQTPEERSARPARLLERAESSLEGYCSGLPDGAEQCWVAYDYFERRKEDAESGCEIDYDTGRRQGADCAKLESFESFVRSLMGHSPMSSFAHLLYTLQKAEQSETAAPRTSGSAEPKISEVKHADGESHFELENVPEKGRERLVALFHAIDRDGNGKLDAGEFRDAMNKLGMARLTGTMVSTILSAMDIHGPITLEDFLHIAEAEEIYSDTPVSRWLRAHRGTSKYWGTPIESM